MIKRKPMKYEPTPIPAGEKYTKLEILDKLEGYDLVDDINSIDEGMMVRYFKKTEEGGLKFCLGGTIVNISGLPVYFMVQSGIMTWSVQVANSTIFRKITKQDIIINELQLKIIELENKLKYK